MENFDEGLLQVVVFFFILSKYVIFVALVFSSEKVCIKYKTASGDMVAEISRKDLSIFEKIKILNFS